MVISSLLLDNSNFPKGGDFMRTELYVPRQLTDTHSQFPEVGSRKAPVSDPVLRGVEELAMVTGRVEVLNQLK